MAGNQGPMLCFFKKIDEKMEKKIGDQISAITNYVQAKNMIITLVFGEKRQIFAKSVMPKWPKIVIITFTPGADS
jgi:hypothetical protein